MIAMTPLKLEVLLRDTRRNFGRREARAPIGEQPQGSPNPLVQELAADLKTE
jgi:hypothetical protein